MSNQRLRLQRAPAPPCLPGTWRRKRCPGTLSCCSEEASLWLKGARCVRGRRRGKETDLFYKVKPSAWFLAERWLCLFLSTGVWSVPLARRSDDSASLHSSLGHCRHPLSPHRYFHRVCQQCCYGNSVFANLGLIGTLKNALIANIVYRHVIENWRWFFCVLNQCQSINLNPLYVMIPCTLSASFAFMLPVATPPNAIVFSYGYLKVSDMVSLCT